MKRGQYYRLLLAAAANPSKVVAAAKTMSLHCSLQTEDSSTKDTTGDALEYDMEGYVQNTLLYWKICLMEGTNNRTVVEEICSGTCKCTQLQIQGQNKQNASYNYTLNGYGAITVPAESSGD